MDANLKLDVDKLEEFTEAIEDGETLEYLRKKAKKEKYHFSIPKRMTDEDANKEILKEIATRVLTTASTYQDEDKNIYDLKPYQHSTC